MPVRKGSGVAWRGVARLGAGRKHGVSDNSRFITRPNQAPGSIINGGRRSVNREARHAGASLELEPARSLCSVSPSGIDCVRGEAGGTGGQGGRSTLIATLAYPPSPSPFENNKLCFSTESAQKKMH